MKNNYKTLLFSVLLAFISISEVFGQESAEDLFNKANKILSRTDEYLGGKNIKKNDIDKSISELEGAIKLNPNYGEAYLLLGKTLNKYSRVYLEMMSPESKITEEKAHNALKKAVEFMPESAEAHYLISATYKIVENNEKKYFEEIEIALKLDSQNSWIWYSYGQRLIGVGRVEEGLNAMKKAVNLGLPDGESAEISYAEILYKYKRYEDAIIEYRKFNGLHFESRIKELEDLIKKQGGTIPPLKENPKAITEETKKPELFAPTSVLSISSKESAKSSEQKIPLPIVPTKEAEKSELRVIIYFGAGIVAFILIGIAIFLKKRKSERK